MAKAVSKSTQRRYELEYALLKRLSKGHAGKPGEIADSLCAEGYDKSVWDSDTAHFPDIVSRTLIRMEREGWVKLSRASSDGRKTIHRAWILKPGRERREALAGKLEILSSPRTRKTTQPRGTIRLESPGFKRKPPTKAQTLMENRELMEEYAELGEKLTYALQREPSGNGHIVISHLKPEHQEVLRNLAKTFEGTS